jgi:hypothetical protein
MWALLAVIPIAIWSYYNRTEDKKPESQVSEIEITVKQSEGIPYVYLKELNVGALKVLDSLDIRRESKGVFYIDSKEAGFYTIQAGQQAPIVLVVEPREKLKLTVDAKGPHAAYEVVGSPGSAILKEFQQTLARAQQSIDSMKLVFEAVRNTDEYPSMRPRLDMAYRKIFDEQQVVARDFVNQHLVSLASLFIINQRLGPQRLLTMEQDFSLFNRLDSALMKKYPTNKHAIDHHTRVSAEKRKIAERQLAGENAAAKTIAE